MKLVNEKKTVDPLPGVHHHIFAAGLNCSSRWQKAETGKQGLKKGNQKLQKALNKKSLSVLKNL